MSSQTITKTPHNFGENLRLISLNRTGGNLVENSDHDCWVQTRPFPSSWNFASEPQLPRYFFSTPVLMHGELTCTAFYRLS